MRTEDSQSSSTKEANISHCALQPPSLGTQLCTSVLHVHSALHVPAASIQTHSWALSKILLQVSNKGVCDLISIVHRSMTECDLNLSEWRLRSGWGRWSMGAMGNKWEERSEEKQQLICKINEKKY